MQIAVYCDRPVARNTLFANHVYVLTKREVSDCGCVHRVWLSFAECAGSGEAALATVRSSSGWVV